MSFSMQTPIPARFEELIYEEKGDVATITLNRPKVVNALSVKLSDELVAAVEKVRQSETIKTLVFRGAGGNFCAGDDLKEFLKLPEWGDSNRAFRRARFYQDMAYSIEELDKITIAAVDGFAVGGGLEITMACDFVIATERAKWGMPEADWGITPGWGGTTRMARLIGRRRTKEINILAALHPAKTAVAWHLWNRVVPNDSLDAEVAKLIDLLRRKNQQTVRQLKYIINKGVECDLYTAQAMEALSAGWTFELLRRGVVADHDAAAGLEAFRDKNDLQKKRRNAARDFWTKPAI
jgi:enoyl-CoA hydratase